MADIDNTSYCSDCKTNTATVLDHSTGDTICMDCGLVLDSHFIDETSEWRTFADSADDHDPNRVGSPTDPLLASLGGGGGLHTVIAPAKPRGGFGSNDGGTGTVSKQQQQMSLKSDRSHSHLLSAFATIASMADRLGLVPTIKDRANEVYAKVVRAEDHQKLNRSKNHDSLLAASLYVACNQENVPRTVKEICSVANGASKKDLGRAKSYIMKRLAEGDGHHQGAPEMMRAIRASDFVKRFCSNLGIRDNRVMKAAHEAVKNSEDEDVRRSPISIAAAVIYIVVQLWEKKERRKAKPIRDFVVATGVAEGTIRNAYKDLFPHLGKIIPGWFAKEDEIKNLCSP